MTNYEQALRDLVTPLAENTVNVKQMPSLDDREILLYVYADNEDVARLIGKRGSMSLAIRQVMALSTADESKKLTIKFESL